MSYTVLFYDAAASSGTPKEVFLAACEEDPVPAGRSARVATFVRRAVAAVPAIRDTESVDASADPRGNFFMLVVPMSADPHLMDRIFAIAADCGLSSYDPQLEPFEGPEETIGIDDDDLPPPIPKNERLAYALLFFDPAVAAGDGRVVFRDLTRVLGKTTSLAAGKSPRVGRFVARAMRKYPELKETGGVNFSSAWSPSNYFLLFLPLPGGEQYVAPLTAMAHRFGLTTYDPQTDPEARRYLAAWD